MANWRDLLREYWLYLVIGLVVVGYFGWQAVQPTPTPLTVATSSAVSTVSTASTSSPSAGYVYVQGAVASPGLYPVTGSTRWAAVVAAAGGLTKQADSSGLNLAKIAGDQESLYVPSKGEAPVAASSASGISTATASGGALDLNTASEADLQSLSGIGPKRAADIIAYRDAHGGFKTVEELKEVSGIGDKIFESLAPNVTVGP